MMCVKKVLTPEPPMGWLPSREDLPMKIYISETNDHFTSLPTDIPPNSQPRKAEKVK